MKTVILGLLFSVQMLFAQPSFAADLQGDMLYTRLYTSLSMRAIQIDLEEMCKHLQKNDCFVNNGLFDNVPENKPSHDIAMVAIDREVFGKYYAEKSNAFSAMKQILKQRGMPKDKEIVRLANAALWKLKTLALTQDLQVSSAILYSPITNERLMAIVLKNSKYKNAEVITFGAGEATETFMAVSPGPSMGGF